MKSTLSATHLLRHFVLFALTTLFLLTMVRAAYSLWQFPKVMEQDALLTVFATGLRFDLALIGALLMVPLIVGPLLGMFSGTRAIAKVFLVCWLLLSMLLVLLSELVTPYFMMESGIRPDVSSLLSVAKPMDVVAKLWTTYSIPMVVGLLLVVMIIIAYWARLETNRLLRIRLSVPTALLLIVVGCMVSRLAIWSRVELSSGPLDPVAAMITEEVVLNEIAQNSAYKLLHSTLQPFVIDILAD